MLLLSDAVRLCMLVTREIPKLSPFKIDKHLDISDRHKATLDIRLRQEIKTLH